MIKLPKNTIKLLRNPNISKVFANQVFDISALKLKHGVDIKGRVHDILVMAHLIDENSYSYSLKSVATAYTDMGSLKDMADEVYRGDEITNESLVIRAGLDTDATLRSFNVLKEQINADKKLLRYYQKFVMPTMSMFTDIHFHGCKIDTEALKESEQEALSIMEDLKRKALKELPKYFIKKYEDKIDSKQSIGNASLVLGYLFLDKKGLRLKPNKRYITEKTKQPQNTEDHLKQFNHIPFVKYLLEYKKVFTLYSHYLEKFWKYIKDDKYIYPTHHLNKATTGRSVILDPAMQKIPQRGDYAYLVKRIFIVDEDEVLFARDLSQNELRVHGWLASDKNILQALQSGVDLHSRTAALLNSKQIKDVLKQERQDAKGVNFGEIYGQRPFGLQKYLADKYNIHYSLEKCEKIVEDFFSYPNGYYGVKRYNHETQAKISKEGYIRSFLGRVRHLPDAQINPNSKEEWSTKARAQRQGLNFGTQSPSSDMGLIAKFLFNQEIKTNIKFKGKVKPMLFIHDNVMGRCKKDIQPKATELLGECLSERMPEYIKKNFKKSLDFPIESDLKLGNSWANLKEIK